MQVLCHSAPNQGQVCLHHESREKDYRGHLDSSLPSRYTHSFRSGICIGVINIDIYRQILILSVIIDSPHQFDISVFFYIEH